jgi:hypothetical protein
MRTLSPVRDDGGLGNVGVGAEADIVFGIGPVDADKGGAGHR